nr:hypothetical protein [Tanacetum cinerariifolium]
KDDEEDKETGKGDDEVRESKGESEEKKETSEEEEGSFDPIPRTPKDSEKESDDEEEQESRLSEEARRQEYTRRRRGLQVTQNVEDTHVTLTPVNPDAFRFEERLRLLETSFSEYRQTNQFADVVSAIPGIVHQ